MSILLDALKKSERRQRAGTVPGLAAEPAPMAEQGAGFTRYLLVAVPVLMCIGWLTWQQYRPLDYAVEGTLPAPSAGSVTPVPADPQPGQEPEGQAELETPVADSAPRTPVEQALPGPARAPATEGPGEAPPEQRQAPEPESPQTQSLTEPAPANQAPATATEPSPASAGSRQDSVIGYWELPANVRDGLPPLRVTVLVYSDVEGDRFALVDGQRMHQGDEVQGGGRVAEIRRDGVVFRRGPYRFLVKP